ncbi:hypothetical protein LXL04_036288 [Taraxacum kok-saghyz]
MRKPAVTLTFYANSSVTLKSSPIKGNVLTTNSINQFQISYSYRFLHNLNSQNTNSYLEMAQISSIVKKASVLAVVALSAVATVSAQSMAPAPSPDAGAAFSVPISGVVIGSSMLLSLVALLRN